LAEYDVEIIHNINNNLITGTVNNFSIVKSGSDLIISFDYVWNKNNGEPYVDASNNLHLLSVHLMDPTKTYFYPWRCVSGINVTNSNQNSVSGTASITVSPSVMGLDSFSFGYYYFSIKFIGHRSIYPIYGSYNLTDISITPTPTATQHYGCDLIGNTIYKN
jgi:hypothetical protein